MLPKDSLFPSLQEVSIFSDLPVFKKQGEREYNKDMNLPQNEYYLFHMNSSFKASNFQAALNDRQ